MELAIAPPSRITAGTPLARPIVVTFTTGDQDKQSNGDTFTLRETSGVWAFLSLTTPDMQQTLDPPQTDLLRGKRTDSIHPIHQDQDAKSIIVAYATFPELIITKPGTYRIKVNIIDMNSPFEGTSGLAAGTVMPSLHSEIIDVVEGGELAAEDDAPAAIRARLRAIGVDC